MIHLVAQSRNGIDVYVDYDHTNVALHITETPNLIALVQEAIPNFDVVDEKVALQHDMGRIIGKTSLVATDEHDDIMYAKRHGRPTYTRFALGRALTDTSVLSVILFCADSNDGTYRLWSAWCGPLVPSSTSADGRLFWQNHALAYDPRIIDTATITRQDPGV